MFHSNCFGLSGSLGRPSSVRPSAIAEMTGAQTSGLPKIVSQLKVSLGSDKILVATRIVVTAQGNTQRKNTRRIISDKVRLVPGRCLGG